jgi:hypothetical protein
MNFITMNQSARYSMENLEVLLNAASIIRFSLSTVVGILIN